MVLCCRAARQGADRDHALPTQHSALRWRYTLCACLPLIQLLNCSLSDRHAGDIEEQISHQKSVRSARRSSARLDGNQRGYAFWLCSLFDRVFIVLICFCAASGLAPLPDSPTLAPQKSKGVHFGRDHKTPYSHKYRTGGLLFCSFVFDVLIVLKQAQSRRSPFVRAAVVLAQGSHCRRLQRQEAQAMKRPMAQQRSLHRQQARVRASAPRVTRRVCR